MAQQRKSFNDWGLLPHQRPELRGECIVLTSEQLTLLIQETVRITLAEQGVKGHPSQSGRIYRKQMVEILGRVRYDEAVVNGWLFVDKHDPTKSNSKVFATRENWERFLKHHAYGKRKWPPWWPPVESMFIYYWVFKGKKVVRCRFEPGILVPLLGNSIHTLSLPGRRSRGTF